MAHRIDEAYAIMQANDRGGYTIPTSRLYPYQWNWDSAFAALGFAAFDRNRAWTELETLFDAQWPNGMVPHIVFRRDDPDYFPGPSVWQSNTTPPSSGHSQPPVATSVAKWLIDSGGPDDIERARNLFPAMMRYHQWFHAARDPHETGLIAITHPWESGRDNCGDWDAAMARVPVDHGLGDYKRRDVSHVDASERPTQAQYDRYLSLVAFGQRTGWDHLEIYKTGPFLMVDPGVHFILMQADQDLLDMADTLGFSGDVKVIESWITRYASADIQLWNSEISAFTAMDLKSREQVPAITNASFLSLYAGAGTTDQTLQTVEHLRAIQASCKVGVPSWDPRHQDYEPQRYWRGPVWAMINYLIVLGLERCGEPELASELQAETLRMIEDAGFYEYFNSKTGEGCGGPDFTWTAAIYLAWTVGLEAQNADRKAS